MNEMESGKEFGSEMRIRPDTEGDVQQLRELFDQLGYPSEAGALSARLRMLRGHDDYLTLVAEHSGRLIGAISLHRELPLLHEECEVRVMALVVSEESRGTGVGSRLLEAAEDWARECGAAYVCLNSGNREERRGAHLFYQVRGYAAGSTGFAKSLKQ